MKALRRIADRLNELADENDKGHAPDAHELRVASEQLEAQADMIEKGLHE